MQTRSAKARFILAFSAVMNAWRKWRDECLAEIKFIDQCAAQEERKDAFWKNNKTGGGAMNTAHIYEDQPPTCLLAGVFAHLAKHMETGCPQAANLAAMLLVRVADDPEADPHLREHAQELVEILERDQVPVSRQAVPATATGRAMAIRLRALRTEAALHARAV